MIEALNQVFPSLQACTDDWAQERLFGFVLLNRRQNSRSLVMLGNVSSTSSDACTVVSTEDGDNHPESLSTAQKKKANKAFKKQQTIDATAARKTQPGNHKTLPSPLQPSGKVRGKGKGKMPVMAPVIATPTLSPASVQMAPSIGLSDTSGRSIRGNKRKTPKQIAIDNEQAAAKRAKVEKIQKTKENEVKKMGRSEAADKLAARERARASVIEADEDDNDESVTDDESVNDGSGSEESDDTEDDDDEPMEGYEYVQVQILQKKKA